MSPARWARAVACDNWYLHLLGPRDWHHLRRSVPGREYAGPRFHWVYSATRVQGLRLLLETGYASCFLWAGGAHLLYNHGGGDVRGCARPGINLGSINFSVHHLASCAFAGLGTRGCSSSRFDRSAWPARQGGAVPALQLYPFLDAASNGGGCRSRTRRLVTAPPVRLARATGLGASAQPSVFAPALWAAPSSIRAIVPRSLPVSACQRMQCSATFFLSPRLAGSCRSGFGCMLGRLLLVSQALGHLARCQGDVDCGRGHVYVLFPHGLAQLGSQGGDLFDPACGTVSAWGRGPSCDVCARCCRGGRGSHGSPGFRAARRHRPSLVSSGIVDLPRWCDWVFMAIYFTHAPVWGHYKRTIVAARVVAGVRKPLSRRSARHLAFLHLLAIVCRGQVYSGPRLTEAVLDFSLRSSCIHRSDAPVGDRVVFMLGP